MTTFERAVAVSHKMLEGVTAKFSDLESKNTSLQKELKTSLKTNAETETGLFKNLGEMPDYLGKKRGSVTCLGQKLANSGKDWQACVMHQR